MLNTRKERGDTLIEVLFAVTVFSLIVVGSLTIMNQGLSASQRSLEITQVRQQIDGQAETLRYIHDVYVAAYQPGMNPASLTGTAKQWNEIVTKSSVTSASQFGTDMDTCPTPPTKSFIVDPKTALYTTGSGAFTTPDTIATLTYGAGGVQSEGLWVEAVSSATSSDPEQQGVGYVDFHIRACWDAPGLNRPMNIGTIVRLYEPRG